MWLVNDIQDGWTSGQAEVTSKMAPGPTEPALDLSVLSTTPLVGGTDVNSITDHPVTPVDKHFVRNHFEIPDLDAASWSVKIDGRVETPVTLTLDDLKAMEKKEVATVLECAGNSRATVQPPIEGLMWDNGGVSSSCWVGVPVEAVLARAGVQDGAVEVLFNGADAGSEHGADGEVTYAMSFPLDRAMHPDSILAYEMNGGPLPAAHGFPLRLVIPGWYGMASVKWVSDIQVLDRPFDNGFHQHTYYVFIDQGPNNGRSRKRVTSMKVKSLMSWPRRGEVIKTGVYTVKGVAWSGEAPVTGVEVSTDDGTTWKKAQLGGSASPYAWATWEFEWNVDEAGHYLVRSRATDANGDVQPDKARWNFRGFANNSIHTVPVRVHDTA